MGSVMQRTGVDGVVDGCPGAGWQTGWGDQAAPAASWGVAGVWPVRSLVPVTELAELQHTSDAAAIAEAEAIQARPGPRIPHEVVEAMMGADEATHDAMAAALDARAGEDLPPEQVTALRETIRARRGA